jgi:phage terminase Nu1 subunit (DNA packaging protein)
MTEEWAAEASEVTFNEANTREKFFKAKLAELEFDEKSGKLVSAEDARAKWVELVTLSKTKLLALPSKIKARIPSLSPADVGVIDELIREALEELAKEDDAECEGATG